MIRFDVIADEVEARFRALGEGSPDVVRALGAFARVLRTRIQIGFRNSKSPHGKPWKPLNPVFRSGQPLRNTGRLYGSVQVRQEGNGFIIGTNLRTPGGDHNLGAIHQFGAVVVPRPGPAQTFRGRLLGPIPTASKGFVFLRRAVIPARPFMPLDASGQVDLPQAWAESALSAMARSLGLLA